MSVGDSGYQPSEDEVSSGWHGVSAGERAGCHLGGTRVVRRESYGVGILECRFGAQGVAWSTECHLWVSVRGTRTTGCARSQGVITGQWLGVSTRVHSVSCVSHREKVVSWVTGQRKGRICSGGLQSLRCCLGVGV